jgi:hypothetical protein
MKKKPVELQIHHLVDQRRKISDGAKEEILSIKGTRSAAKVALMYNCSMDSIYEIWNPKRKEQKRINQLKRPYHNGTPEQAVKKATKQNQIKELKKLGLM